MTTKTQAADVDPTVPRNEVWLTGRVSAPPIARELPSGSSILTARLIVDREPQAMAKSAQRVDTIECVGWTVRVQRAMRRWEKGDVVAVEGSIRRRFFRSTVGSASRFEVEVKSARRVG